MRPHLIWDWNGTLLQDQDLVLAATNEAFARLHFPDVKLANITEIGPGVPQLTALSYQQIYTRPLRKFYYAVMGRHISDAEFERWTDLYQQSYLRRVAKARLTEDAPTALRAWRRFGGSQSLLSLWDHERLVRHAHRLGLASYFTRIDGRPGTQVAGFDSKREPLRQHMRQILGCGSPRNPAAVTAGHVVMIGDAADDVTAARAAGIACILFTGGSPPQWAEAIKIPTAATLIEAVELAKAITSVPQVAAPEPEPPTPEAPNT